MPDARSSEGAGSGFTPDSYALLRRAVKRAAGRYPPPSGFRAWTAGAIDEWIHDQFLPRKGYETVVKIQVEGTDQDSIDRIMFAAVRNVFRDEARATTAGKLIDRLDGILRNQTDLLDGSSYTAGTMSWTLADLDSDVYDGDWVDLLGSPALRNVPRLGPLNTAGPTSAANRNALLVAARILVEYAGGAVRAADLAHALVRLFDLDEPTLNALEYGVEGLSLTSSEPEAPGERLMLLQAADEIWRELDKNEVLLLPHLDEPLALIKRLLSPSITKQDVADLKLKLQGLLHDQDDPEGALGIVVARATDFADTYAATQGTTEES